jgi:ABC-2 type transport system ATP-binding protein
MLVAEGLTKRYGKVLAVEELDFAVRPGTITAFLGPNGAGKTTTLRIFLGLVHPTSGTATIDGRPYRELEKPTRVGAVLEATGFYPGRSGRNHLRAFATRCSPSSGSRPPRIAASAATRSACASASGSRPRCSATRKS